MSIPDYQSLMLPVLVVSSKGEVRIGQVVEELADHLKLTPEERSELLPSGQQTVFSNRVHWAKSYLSKANLVEITRRGYFRITARGQTVLQSPPPKIDNNFLKQFEEFRQFLKGSSEPGASAEADSEATVTAIEEHKQTPGETMRLAYRQIETALGHDLLERIREARPDFFERLKCWASSVFSQCACQFTTPPNLGRNEAANQQTPPQHAVSRAFAPGRWSTPNLWRTTGYGRGTPHSSSTYLDRCGVGRAGSLSSRGPASIRQALHHPANAFQTRCS
jgi:hypothetical protein